MSDAEDLVKDLVAAKSSDVAEKGSVLPPRIERHSENVVLQKINDEWGALLKRRIILTEENFDYDCVRSYEDDVEQSGIWIFSVSVPCLQNHSQACFEVALSH